MAKDKNINIKVKANADDAKSTIKNITSELNKFAKALSKNSVSNLATSFNAVVNATKLATSAIRKAIQAGKEIIQLANTQVKAETQLEVAAKNNPYLNKDNVKQLKNFASQLQSIGTIGDETLLPLMAQLAASGRTQAEIQDIMSAALDVSASGAMSLESTVKNLNKTYSGLSGELGESIPQVKNLTTEQLKQGEAVKVIAQQYKGMAQETTKATGSGQQLANALGDLKEQIGMGWATLTAPVNRMLTNVITIVGNAIGKVNELLVFSHVQSETTYSEIDVLNEELLQLRNKQDKISDDLVAKQAKLNSALEKEQTDAAKKRAKKQEDANNAYLNKEKEAATNELKEYQDVYNEYLKQQEQWQEQQKKAEEVLNNSSSTDKQLAAAKKARAQAQTELIKLQTPLETYKALVDRNTTTIEVNEKKIADNAKSSTTLQAQVDELQTQLDTVGAEITAKQAEIATAQNKANNGLSENDQKALDIINENKKAYEAEIALINNKAAALEKLGTPLSAEEIAQQKLNAAEQSYIDLVTKDTSLVTVNNSAAKERLSQAKDYATVLADIQSKKTKTDLVLQWSAESSDAKKELEETKKELEELKNEINAGTIVLPGIDETQITKAIDNVEQKLSELAETTPDKFQEALKNIDTILNSVYSGLSKVEQSFDQYTNLELESIASDTEADQDAVTTQYENGLISYEDYLDKMDELDKEKARKEYKIKLAQWQMDLAMATVDVAKSIASAMTTGTMVEKIANSAIASMMGAAQIATIVANKPSAPSFATGGFLTGNSTSGDKIAFKGNAGEAILNAAEQREFMRYANGEAQGQGVNITMPITIVNNAANDTTVTATQQERQIQITIDKQVNASFKAGTYTDSMTYAQSNKNGSKFL